uniref:Uncharacterized protein n=1 Tax=Schlesneria paludicola TaxID=360056 RepID=A0A7C4LK75_9PLAN
MACADPTALTDGWTVANLVSEPSDFTAVRVPLSQAVAGRRASAVAAWLQSRHGAWHWFHPQQLPAEFSTFDELPWEAWKRTGQLTIVKASRRRLVGRLAGTTGEYFVKRYLAPDAVAWLRQRVLGRSAFREARHLTQLQSRGVPTLEVVAVGYRRQFMVPVESCLITRGLMGVQPLSAWVPDVHLPLPQALHFPHRSRLAAALGDLVGRLHGTGFVHGDLHAANILVRPEAAGWSAWLIDLDRLRFNSGGVSAPAARNDLLRLVLSLHPLATRTDLHSFWTSYCARRGALDDRFEPRSFADWHDVWADRARAAWERADRVWARGNRQIVVTRRGRGLAALGTGFVEQWQHAAAGQGREPTVPAILPRVATPGSELGTKQPLSLRQVRVTTRTRGPCGWSTARHCWEMGHAARRRGLPAAVPWAFVECPAQRWGYVLYSEPAGAVSLAECLQRPMTDSERSRLAHTLRRGLRQMCDLELSTERLTSDDLFVVPGENCCGLRHFERVAWRSEARQPDVDAEVHRLLTGG